MTLLADNRKLRLAAVLGLLLLAAAFVAIPRAEAVGEEVTVIGSEGTPEYGVELAGLGTDSAAPDGSPGYSLSSVLTKAQDERPALDWQSAEYIEIPKASGSQKRISPMSVELADKESRPYFYVGEDGSVNFVQPQAGSAGFKVSGPVRLGPVSDVAVAVTASDYEPDVGEKVDFTAIPQGLPPGTSPSFSWDFGDGKTSAGGKTISHTFKSAGKFRVEVSVTTPAGPESGVVEVQVGEPEKSKKKRDGGGKEDDGGETGVTDGGTGTSGYYGDTGTGTGPYGSPDGYTDPNPEAQPNQAAQNQPPPEKPDPRPVDDGLETVTGELVSASSPVPLGTPDAGGAVPTPEALQDGTPDEGRQVPDWVWTILGIFALIGFGIAVERRSARYG